MGFNLFRKQRGIFRCDFIVYIKFTCLPYNCSETNLGELLVDLKVIITLVFNYLPIIQVTLHASFHFILMFPQPHFISPFYEMREPTQGAVSSLSKVKARAYRNRFLRLRLCPRR